MTISEKVAYIKGLAEGMDISASTKPGKLLNAILDVLEDMALEISDLNDNQLDIGDELDAISDDLADVEEFVFGPECCDDDDECCCCDDDDDECCCEEEAAEETCCCEEKAAEEECCCEAEEEEPEQEETEVVEEAEVEEDDGEPLFEVTCPICNADIALTEAQLMKGEMKCPSCGEMLEFEFDDEEE